jgi:hypothetical protein
MKIISYNIETNIFYFDDGHKAWFDGEEWIVDWCNWGNMKLNSNGRRYKAVLKQITKYLQSRGM